METIKELFQKSNIIVSEAFEAKLQRLSSSSGADVGTILEKALDLTSKAYAVNPFLFGDKPSPLMKAMVNSVSQISEPETKQAAKKTYNKKPVHAPKEHIETVTQKINLSEYMDKIAFIYGRSLTDAEAASFILFVEHYQMPAEVIILLTEWCVTKRKVTRLSYIETTVRDWYDRNIITLERAQKTIDKMESRRNSESNVIMIFQEIDQQAIWEGKELSEKESKTIEKWFEMGADIEDIKDSANICFRTKGQIEIPYTGGILRNRLKDKKAWRK